MHAYVCVPLFMNREVQFASFIWCLSLSTSNMFIGNLSSRTMAIIRFIEYFSVKIKTKIANKFLYKIVQGVSKPFTIKNWDIIILIQEKTTLWFKWTSKSGVSSGK
jgi:hypothetical protein